MTASRLPGRYLAGPIDVLTGDYLAEMTMLILWKAKQKDDSSSYATTFLRQLEDVLHDKCPRQCDTPRSML